MTAHKIKAMQQVMTLRLDSPEEKINALRMELLVLGFAAAKEIAALRKQKSGVMQCPLCMKELRFLIDSGNGHMQARCATAGCINMME